MEDKKVINAYELINKSKITATSMQVGIILQEILIALKTYNKVVVEVSDINLWLLKEDLPSLPWYHQYKDLKERLIIQCETRPKLVDELWDCIAKGTNYGEDISRHIVFKPSRNVYVPNVSCFEKDNVNLFSRLDKYFIKDCMVGYCTDLVTHKEKYTVKYTLLSYYDEEVIMTEDELLARGASQDESYALENMRKKLLTIAASECKRLKPAIQSVEDWIKMHNKAMEAERWNKLKEKENV